MVAPYLLSSSTVVPTSPEVALQGVLDAPLEDLFTQRGGLIPAIKECTGQDGPWGTPGQTRTVVLADGSTNLETLVSVDAPDRYRYQLSDFTGPMKLLVSRVDGEFTFVPEGSGTRVTWNWSIEPKNALTRLPMPVLGASWRKFADRMWPNYAARLAG